MPEGSILPDAAFRFYTIAFIQRVSHATLYGSTGRLTELRTLVSEYPHTSQDINMQEMLVMLHSQYDLVKLGCFEPGILEDMTARVNSTARGEAVTKAKAGSGRGKSSGSNEIQHGLTASEFVEATLGVGSHVVKDSAMPGKLKGEGLGVQDKEATEDKKTQNKAA